jgi:RNA polymerase sigma factor (sigma-70 family)
LAQSDRKAVEGIYRDHFNTIQTLIINNNGSADDAKDVFQESMIVLFEKVRSGNFELQCQLRTFLYSVARRIWLKRLQQQNRYTSPGDNMEPIVAVDEDLASHEERNAEFELMEKAINHLGEPCKSLLEAYYLQKKTMQTIAASFGYTNAENAKNQKYKCLLRLKKIFFSHYKNGDSDG